MYLVEQVDPVVRPRSPSSSAPNACGSVRRRAALRRPFAFTLRAMPNSQPAKSDEVPLKSAILRAATSHASAATSSPAAQGSPVATVPSQTSSRPACAA